MEGGEQHVVGGQKAEGKEKKATGGPGRQEAGSRERLGEGGRQA